MHCVAAMCAALQAACSSPHPGTLADYATMTHVAEIRQATALHSSERRKSIVKKSLKPSTSNVS